MTVRMKLPFTGRGSSGFTLSLLLTHLAIHTHSFTIRQLEQLETKTTSWTSPCFHLDLRNRFTLTFRFVIY